ncbi:MAG: PD-(D/E)XK motif protein, partial [Syntrophales bacterium]
LRNILGQTPEALAMFNSALLNIGFFDASSDRYTRRFLFSERKIMRVLGQFPRLTRSNVRIGIKNAKYELDLDMINNCDVDFAEALSQLKLGYIWN